jgi:hypothetical protein
MNLALLTTTLTAEIEANLSETSSSNCSSSNEDDNDVMLVDITDMLMQHTAWVVADIEGGTKDCTNKWRQFGCLLIQVYPKMMPSPIFGSESVTYKKWQTRFGLEFRSILSEARWQ